MRYTWELHYNTGSPSANLHGKSRFLEHSLDIVHDRELWQICDE